MDNKKCTQCKLDQAIEEYYLRMNGDRGANCRACREYKKASKIKNHCEHGRQRAQCIPCGGSQMCDHGRQRAQCKDCSDPVEITLKAMVYHAKHSDTKHNMYNANHHIDIPFLHQLAFEYSRCNWCQVEMLYNPSDDERGMLATVERLDNTIGHSKANCVLACYSCNSGRVGDRQMTPARE